MSLSLVEELSLLPDAVRDAVLGDFDDDALMALATTWEFLARPEQIAPEWAWDYWLIIGGRGSGKTRPAAELVHQWAGELPGGYIAIVGETSAEVRDVMVEGPSGLLATARPGNRCKYEPSKRRVVWQNGFWGTTFSGDEPDQLRGPNAHKAWVDELAKFKYPQETWDNLELILRKGDPQGVVSTTPRPLSLLRQLLADTEHNHVTRYSTYANIANLAPAFIRRIVRRYEGTRLGRQELWAEMLDDTPGALWTRGGLDKTRLRRQPALQRIVVGVDPGRNAGIVVMGLGEDGHGYALDDMSCEDASPTEWATQVVTAYHKYHANVVVAERNHGGDMVETMIRTIDPSVPTHTVWASEGKYARAEPVSALYEQGRMHHVGMFPKLEDQMCDWVPGEGMPSPDRLDALVWAATYLLLQERGLPDIDLSGAFDMTQVSPWT